MAATTEYTGKIHPAALVEWTQLDATRPQRYNAGAKMYSQNKSRERRRASVLLCYYATMSVYVCTDMPVCYDNELIEYYRNSAG